MKKGIQLTSFKAVLLVITLIAATSCNDSQKHEDSKDVAEEHNETKYDNEVKEKDSQFLVDAAEINMEEIQLGQLTQKNSSMSDVKELAKMMEKEHGELLVNLTTLAAKKMITIPTSLTDRGMDAYVKLSKKSGNEFNKEYCEMMVKGHEDAISLFEKASTDCSDSDVREWASSTISVLRTHLDHAVICQKKCEQMK